jgi:DnaJ-class molecular chaperone
MEEKDYYHILQIRRDSSAEEIKRAYRQLAFQFHPDRNPGDTEAEQRFKDISEAYEVLGTPEKKIMYDLYRTPFTKRVNREFHSFRSRFSQDTDTFFNHFTNAGCRRRRFKQCRPFRDTDTDTSPFAEGIRCRLVISPEEAMYGTEREIVFQGIYGQKRFSIRIPAGVQNGMKLAFPAEPDIPFADTINIQILIK